MSSVKGPINLPGVLALGVLATLALVSAKAWTATSSPEDIASSRVTSAASRVPPVAVGLNESAVGASVHNEIGNVQRAANDESIEVEVITVQPNGFEPQEITRPQGRFLMVITNRTGLSEFALRLDRVGGGGRVQEVRMRRGRVRWQQALDLPAGDYVLSEENHPDWVCRLRLTRP